jgi:hypothetical protein
MGGRVKGVVGNRMQFKAKWEAIWEDGEMGNFMAKWE